MGLCSAVLACAPETTAVAAPTPTSVKGRVVDDTGRGLAEVWVRLIDTTRVTGRHDNQGCATYRPQWSVPTDAQGRFSAELPFQPTRAEVSGQLAWVELPRGPFDVTPGEELNIVGRTIPHRTLRGRVTDAEGRPVPGTTLQSEGPGWHGRADESGRFELEVAEPPPTHFRARRMGYQPVVVSADELEHIVLAQRRPMVTVTVLEPEGQPVSRLQGVSIWKNGERLSFCTAGNTEYTQEPTTGVCALDAEPGQVELRLEGKPVATLEVSTGPQAVTVTAAPFVPVIGSPY